MSLKRRRSFVSSLGKNRFWISECYNRQSIQQPVIFVVVPLVELLQHAFDMHYAFIRKMSPLYLNTHIINISFYILLITFRNWGKFGNRQPNAMLFIGISVDFSITPHEYLRFSNACFTHQVMKIPPQNFNLGAMLIIGLLLYMSCFLYK